jgi:hypothetical protein
MNFIIPTLHILTSSIRWQSQREVSTKAITLLYQSTQAVQARFVHPVLDAPEVGGETDFVIASGLDFVIHPL